MTHLIIEHGLIIIHFRKLQHVTMNHRIIIHYANHQEFNSESEPTKKTLISENQQPKNGFAQMTTVYGGTNGKNSFLIDQTIQSVFIIMNAVKEIPSIDNHDLYINSNIQIQDFNSITTKMCETVFNYKTVMLDASFTSPASL